MMKATDFSLSSVWTSCVGNYGSYSYGPVNLERFVKHYAFKERIQASFIPHDNALLSLNFLLTSVVVCVGGLS